MVEIEKANRALELAIEELDEMKLQIKVLNEKLQNSISKGSFEWIDEYSSDISKKALIAHQLELVIRRFGVELD